MNSVNSTILSFIMVVMSVLILIVEKSIADFVKAMASRLTAKSSPHPDSLSRYLVGR